VEFAKLDPVSLLRETQRAAAPEQMVEWHNELKGLRTEEKALELQQQNEHAHLKSLQAKQNATREDVERYNQRQELTVKSQTLEKCRPIITMKILATEVRKLKAELRTKEQERDQYKAEVEPAQKAQEEMESYRDQVERVANARKERFDNCKTTAERLAARIETEQQSFTSFSAEVAAERQAEKTRKTDMKRTEGDISRLKSMRENNSVQYDHDGFEARKADFHRQASAADRKVVEIMDTVKRINRDVVGRRELLKRKLGAREELNTQSGQQGTLLKKMSGHTYEGWNWLEKNMASLGLNDTVYPPPILCCSVPDSQFASVVESQLRPGDLIALTCTNARDAKIVADKLLGKKDDGGLELHHITIRTCPHPRAYYHSPLTDVELKDLGFDGWIGDYIQGPDAVLAMLCDSAKLHRSAYTSRSISNEQFSAIQAKKLSKWVSGKEIYQITTRREYNASSTSVTRIRDAQYFTDQPVDTVEKHRLDEEIKELKRDIEMQGVEHTEVVGQLEVVKEQKKDAEANRVRSLTQVSLRC
jgi:hypothetical protein